MDPNRNYGGFWGGAGASTNPTRDTFRGTGPFSEPETQNIRWLHSERQITNLITNHTYSNLVLRPPGVADTRPPLEEPLLEQLGARMTSHNDYANIPGYGLYDTTGSTEDWTFWTCRQPRLHVRDRAERVPPAVPDRSGGRVPRPGPGRGRGPGRQPRGLLRDAGVDRRTARHHSLITGRAPDGWTLKLHKSFMTSTSPVWNNDFGTDIGERPAVPGRARLRVPLRRRALRVARQPVHAAGGGRAAADATRWPSRRPDHAGQPGRASRRRTPATPAGAYESIPFTVGGPPEVDNGRMTVHIEWAQPGDRLGSVRGRLRGHGRVAVGLVR